MSVLQRFRERDNKPATVVVSYPTAEPVIELTVKRLPPAMVSNASLAASAAVKKRGFVENEPDYEKAHNLAFYFEIAAAMRPHVSVWRAVDGGELPPCNQAQVSAFYDQMVYIDQVMLGLSYIEAVAKLEKKSEA